MAAQLKPQKYPQGPLFVCDVTDVILKDDMASMEHPFYSLSKKPDLKPRRYEHNDKWIEFRPSLKGLPTIYDKDLIIYAISHLISCIKEGEEIPKQVEIDPYAFFLFTGRGTGGRDYQALCDSLDRIDGTRYRTNVIANGTKKDVWMGIIDGAELETDEKTNKPRKLRIMLSDMIIDALRERSKVLTLHKSYFRLRKPIQRRVYELARKHCGHQDSWSVSIAVLHRKSGSRSSSREFRRAIREMVEENPLPDYTLALEADADVVTFHNRNQSSLSPSEPWSGRLHTQAYEDAKKVAPGWDVYFLEAQWREWVTENEIEPKYPARHFVKFCQSWYERRGPAR